MLGSTSLADVTAGDVEELFAKRADELHAKVDATRDAYFGFIFPVTSRDFRAVTEVFGLSHDAARALYEQGTAFSTFRPRKRGGQITNHIVGGSILALRGRDLDAGLGDVSDKNIGAFVDANGLAIEEIAEARRGWFGRIYFPAQAFANAIGVFGGHVSPETLHRLAEDRGYAAVAGQRLTIRGDFGIGLWLTLLARA
ncbi:MAG: hypothetical protein HY263_09015 [Chloroflexi bacterium]|nr:hypothetical protein [Chloroflexota bacterium]